MSPSKWLTSGAIVSLLFNSIAKASLSEVDYYSALKAADQKVGRQKKATLPRTSSLRNGVAPQLSTLPDSKYTVGSTWTVAAWSIKHPLQSLTTHGHTEEASKAIAGGFFNYKVLAVTNEAGIHITTIKIIQITNTTVDPRVESLTLTLETRLGVTKQVRKAYKFFSQNEPVIVSPEGVHSAATILELFPLDFINLSAAQSQPATAAPKLPEFAESVAKKTGHRIHPDQTTAFEQDDFFGRPVKILWQEKTPWPAYIHTANGIAILLPESTP
ncbi:MAG: hypothetical protein AABZ06_04565 [Bdellovibrionota bacterium]